MMNKAALVAIAATVGNFLQGWDNATIAGAVVYIKKELELESTMEGLIVAMSLIGATLITTCSGTMSDWLGRRPMLILSSMFYFLSGVIMLWSPNVYVLLIARLFEGFGGGLAITLVPLYISETAPSDIRGLLNTFPQLSGTGGMFFAYCMIFGLSLMPSPSWRVMLGVLCIPSLVYFALAVLYLPESPRWLVSKGRMLEAKQVLEKLRGKDDVAGEMALLIEGLAVGGETSIEEYLISKADGLDENQEPSADRNNIRLYGPEEGQSWIAKPVTGQSGIAPVSRQGSMVNQTTSFMSPLVTLFGSVHEKLPESGMMQLPNSGSMMGTDEPVVKNEEWDEESLQREGEGYSSDGGGADSDGNLRTPLIERQDTTTEKDTIPLEGVMSVRRHSTFINAGEAVDSTEIGGGWQLAWKWSEREGEDGRKGGEFKRMYLLQQEGTESRYGSFISVTGGNVQQDGDYIHASALVSQPALYAEKLMDHRPVGPAMVHPSETASKGLNWADLLEPGVKSALIVGIGIQMLQQLSGTYGVLYYTPQILEKAGVSGLLSNLGIGSESASLLICAITNFLMLPCIVIAMRLMDVAGRRSLLLTTIPVLVVSLVLLVISDLVSLGTTVNAVISTISLVIYFCFFVMGYGPIPNILCSEIFPTRVRGICIAICALVFWISDVIVTYSIPVMLSSIGLGGVFGIFAVVSVISWIFIYLRIPETKGMPLEVITEFFAVGAKKAAVKSE